MRAKINRKKSHQGRPPRGMKKAAPVAIPLPFEEAVAALLATPAKPSSKRKRTKY